LLTVAVEVVVNNLPLLLQNELQLVVVKLLTICPPLIMNPLLLTETQIKLERIKFRAIFHPPTENLLRNRKN